jgi:hypothetical protein
MPLDRRPVVQQTQPEDPQRRGRAAHGPQASPNLTRPSAGQPATAGTPVGRTAPESRTSQPPS